MQVFRSSSVYRSFLHCLPPFCAVLFNDWILICIPSPQVELHFEYSPNLFHLQSTKKIDIFKEIFFGKTIFTYVT